MIYSLDGFRLVGPGMHLVTLEPPSDQEFSESDVLHGPGSRTRGAFGEAAWQRMRSSSVAVIGCGRNGSAAAVILTMLGVRQVTLIDDDRDELNGLDATLGDVARYEVAAPAGALRRGPRQAWFEQRAGSLLTINLVAVNVGIQLWLDLLAGRVTESRWCRLDWNAQGELHVQTVTSLSSGCPICRNAGTSIDRNQVR